MLVCRNDRPYSVRQITISFSRTSVRARGKRRHRSAMAPGCDCGLRHLGEDVSEQLEFNIFNQLAIQSNIVVKQRLPQDCLLPPTAR
jgi:transposase